MSGLDRRRILFASVLILHNFAAKHGDQGLKNDLADVIELFTDENGVSSEKVSPFVSEHLEQLFFKNYWDITEKLLCWDWVTFQELLDFLNSFEGDEKFEIPAYMVKFRCYDVRKEIADRVHSDYKASKQKGGRPRLIKNKEAKEYIALFVKYGPQEKNAINDLKCDLNEEYDLPESSFYDLLREARGELANKEKSIGAYMDRMGID